MQGENAFLVSEAESQPAVDVSEITEIATCVHLQGRVAAHNVPGADLIGAIARGNVGAQNDDFAISTGYRCVREKMHHRMQTVAWGDADQPAVEEDQGIIVVECAQIDREQTEFGILVSCDVKNKVFGIQPRDSGDVSADIGADSLKRLGF